MCCLTDSLVLGGPDTFANVSGSIVDAFVDATAKSNNTFLRVPVCARDGMTDRVDVTFLV